MTTDARQRAREAMISVFMRSGQARHWAELHADAHEAYFDERMRGERVSDDPNWCEHCGTNIGAVEPLRARVAELETALDQAVNASTVRAVRIVELEAVVRAADAIAAAITHDHLAEHDERHALLSDYTIARAKVQVPGE